MDLVQALDLRRLASDRGAARASVFLPISPGGLAVGENRIRLKNLLRRVEDSLVRDGLSADAEALVNGVRRMIDDEWRWQQLSDGLALFASPGGVRYFRVPLPLPELATVGRSFLIGPLLPMLAAQGHFFVLALDSDITLFKGARFRFHEVTLNSALRAELTMGRPRRRQVHAFVADRGGAGARAVFHGIGGGAEDRQESVLQHFHRVDRVVRDVLAGERAPLVLAAVRHRRALYRTANTYPGLLADGIDGNPRDIPIDLLHRRGWEIAEPELRGAERDAASTYGALRGTGRTANRPEEMLLAAGHGRVDTSFLSTDRTWGQPHPRGHRCSVSGPHPPPGSSSISPPSPPSNMAEPSSPSRRIACPTSRPALRRSATSTRNLAPSW